MINLEVYTIPLYLAAGEVYNTDYRQDYTFSEKQVWNLATICSQHGIVFYSFIKNRYFFSFNANDCKIISRKTLQLWENSFVETPEDIRTRLEIVQLSKIYR